MYAGMRYTSTMKGSVVKVVPCEGCGAEYVYRLNCTGVGTGRSAYFLDNEGAKARAAAAAEASLRRQLETGCAVVPCPSCGHIQANMATKARKKYRHWMITLGACVALAALPLALVGAAVNDSRGRMGGDPAVPWPSFFAGVVAVLLLGVGIIVARSVMASQYDPNREDEEKRIEKGRSIAILRTDLEKMSRKTGPQGG